MAAGGVEGPRPKILITGSPLYVDGEHHPCTIEGGNGTVDDIVRDPEHHYVAAIGGDIHNYQRYPVQVDGRTIQYVVSGGGGAFMHATHTIPRVDIANVTEKDFRCYPLRGDSSPSTAGSTDAACACRACSPSPSTRRWP